MKIVRAFFIFLFIFYLLPLHAEYFNRIGLKEGLTQPSVMAISQDVLGRMWFGTREGLNIYDGEKVTPYRGWVQSADSLIWLGNFISEIQATKNGEMYFISDDNLMKYDLKTSKFYRLDNEDATYALTTFKDQVWYIKHDSIFYLDTNATKERFATTIQTDIRVKTLLVTDDKFFVGHTEGLYQIDRKTNVQKQILDDVFVKYLFFSSKNELWIGTFLNGMYWMDEKGVVRKVPALGNSSQGVKSSQIRQFVEDNSKNVWFGTFDGLYKYDIKTREYIRIQIPESIGGLTHSSIYSLYKDRRGIIWVGTYWGGVNYFEPQNDNYIFYEYDLIAEKNLYYSYLGDMVLDSKNNLWICTDGGGLTCVDENWEIQHRFVAGAKNSLLHNNVKGIAYDKTNESMYIATYTGGLSRYDIKTNRFFNYLTDYNQSGPRPGSIINYIKVMGDKVFMLTNKNFFILDIPTQKFKEIDIPRGMHEGFDVDNQGNLYLIGDKNLVSLNLNNPEKINTLSLADYGCNADITKVLVRNEGVILSTLGSGLFYYNTITKKVSRYSTKNKHLASDVCYNLCLNKEGNILISSANGITYYNPRIDKFSIIDFNTNFPNTYLIRDCGLITSPDGTVFVGSTKGLVTFKELEFHKEEVKSNVKPFLFFNSLSVVDKLIKPNDETGILRTSMPFVKSLHLNHNQNNIKIGYSISDFGMDLVERDLGYKLEGVNKNWIKTEDFYVQYVNLAPGKYTLRVALWSGEKIIQEIQLPIYVSSAWYNTWIAWLIYLILTAMIIRSLVKNRIAKRTLSIRLENERKEKEQIEQLNHEKLVFFTNVSHEFRTPLTLLISHVDILLQKHSFSPTIYNQLLKIRKNAEQMNNLITELLEFRKLTQNHLKLQVVQQDLSAFIKDSFLPFVDYASQRNIKYENHFPIGPVICPFDEHLMSKVIFNLLSNAFKYTPDGGEISISGKMTTDEVEFIVSDSGVGLSEKDVSQIFVRFYQGDNQQKNKVLSPGTGIGLALCKAIIEKHHGEISVESTIGQGSIFKVKLKKSIEVFKNDDQIDIKDATTQEKSYIVDSLPVPNADAVEQKSVYASDEELEEDDSKRVVLLVEDNVELLQILVDLFSPFYQVCTAVNGEEGLQKVYEQKVDLIVSDIMMPKMSGTEMCLQLKNNIDYCHIPIILLTALDSTEQNIEGLSRGADDYITKPFHAGLLLARANNLIRSRLLMQHQFDKRPMSEIDLTSINPLDQELLKKITSIIEEHIDDPLFDIPLLCKELGVSRSLIYAKFKALTGMTPNNFILNFRLKFAATLLKQYKDMPISEVSDRSGFNSPVYFSQCFKKQFGTTPHNYKKEHTAKE